MSRKSHNKRHHATTPANTTVMSHNNTSNTILNPSVPTLTPAQMYSNFEEWIKMCTDNKINATNTWNFALIDYFHEMTFIREGDSINFQKASCTLDGCVKIYTSRVDSVATETGKLLSGLADSSNSNEDEEVRKERRVRRKTQRTDASLVKDFSTISLKKFDLDFAVDPLFKKTSADFDEGGARGLLLNHLGIDRHCKIIFDASDSTLDLEKNEINEQEETNNQEENEVGAEDGIEKDTAQYDQMDEDTKSVDGSDEEGNAEAMEIDSENEQLENERLEDEQLEDEQLEDEQLENEQLEKAEQMELDPERTEKQEENTEERPENEELKDEEKIPDKSGLVEISRLKSKLPDLNSLNELSIVPSLKGFDFFSDTLEIPELHSEEEEMNDTTVEENFLPDYNDDYDIDYGNDIDADPFMDNELGGVEEDAELDETERGFPEKDYLTALLNNESQDLFNYFDNTLVKNWAGPEHWKLRRPPNANKEVDGTTAEEKATKKRTKQVFSIDFKEIEEDEDEDVIFEPATKKITLPNNATSSTKHLLPDDIHFSSKQLLQYFLKPMFPIDGKKKNKNVSIEETGDKTLPTTVPEEENDASFWAEQTQDYGDYDVDIDYSNSLPADITDNPESTLLSAMDDSAYYQDTYDDLETSEIYGDTLITSHQLKRTRPLYVNYARTAKRVDVKKLKDNLWKALIVEDEQVKGVQKFTDIVNNLKKMYPPKVMKDISVPFCFICLLHLANEKDLAITGSNTNDEDDDFVLGEEDWMNNESILNEITVYQNNPS